MKTDLFDYDLDESFIAQSPSVPRDHSKLMIYDTKLNRIYHKKFFEISKFLNSGDTLVLNKSRVFPARILFEVNGSEKEIFILKRLSDFRFKVLLRPAKFFKVGKRIDFGDLSFFVEEILDDASRIIVFDSNLGVDDFNLKLSSFSKIPLPPYIQDDPRFYDNYQTVYSDSSYSSSVAAPTAGLHFTEDLICDLKRNGVNFEKVVLNVGRGTFLPVSSEDILKHKMHSEDYLMPADVAIKLNSLDRKKNRIISVGTTSVRVLESNFHRFSKFKKESSDTDIFIYPKAGFKFKAVDALITNFHLPKSTLIMLVAAFLENKNVENPIDKILELYEIAKENSYRFYSFGDSMFIF